jgi:hypothetical protein
VVFDVAQQFNNVRLVTRLRRIGVWNHRLDLHRYHVSVGSHEPGSSHAFARDWVHGEGSPI